MMNRFSKSIFACAFIVWGLASCTSDDAFVESATTGKTVRMTVVASREADRLQSRTALEQVGGDLACIWTEGDKLFVTDVNGVQKGVLTVKEINSEDQTKATFEGELQGVDNGKTELNYYYLGIKGNLGDDAKTYTADYSQQSGTIASLSEYDILSVRKEVIVENGQSYVPNIDLGRRTSFARFQLKFPDGVEREADDAITISGEGLRNKAVVDVPTLAMTYEAGDVVVNTASDDFYITFLPNDISSYDLKFSVTIGENVTYEGTLPVSKQIVEGKFYRKSTGDALVVEMTKVGDEEPAVEDDCVGPVFEVNGKKFRFTRANLKYNVDTKVWSLMEHQYSFICKGGWALSSGTWSKTKETEIDMFGWGATGLYDIESDETAQQPEFWRQNASQTYTRAHAYYPTDNTYYNGGYTGSYLEHGIQFTNFDWGTAYSPYRNDAKALSYFTLSSSDWTALKAGYFMTGATITDLPNPNNSNKNGVWGCLIFGVKDVDSANEIMKDKVSYISKSLSNNLNFSGTNYVYFNYDYVKMTAAQFDELEKSGQIVFLPEAGYRSTDSMTKTIGYYWTTTAGQSTTAVMFRFDGNSSPKVFKLEAQTGRSLGGAVRLVKEVEVNE